MAEISYRLRTVDVFTDRGLAGNPLAVKLSYGDSDDPTRVEVGGSVVPALTGILMIQT